MLLPEDDYDAGKGSAVLRAAELQPPTNKANLRGVLQAEGKPACIGSGGQQEHGNIRFPSARNPPSNVAPIRWIYKASLPVPWREQGGQAILHRIDRAGIVVETEFSIQCLIDCGVGGPFHLER